MAVYAIGDIQGCFDELEQLLEEIQFDRDNDELWFVGDLVNRGPQSLQTLQFVQALGDKAKCVLGNHDIHLLACYCGVQTCKPGGPLAQVLESAQVDQLIDWLRALPLLHFDAKLNWTMVHAGMLPQWDLPLAQQCAREVEEKFRADDYATFIASLYGNTPNLWRNDLQNEDRWRIIVNAFTRIRLCDENGYMDLEYKGVLGEQATHLHAWFDVPRKSSDLKIVFGHWSALGLKQTENLLCLDTGCLWGNSLTAARLDSGIPQIYSINCEAKRKTS